MPRVKIEYVVSFSSEDPEHPANNLLNREVSKKKWLCRKGESSCSVVLQLTKAVKISAVHIGAYHAALVEVLVARSETSSEQFQVLVPSSVFLSREESRRDGAAERVRSFSAEQLSDARHQRWDRVRLVCSQPHNKHCKYGLSFVHIDESEGSLAPAVPPRLLPLDTFSSDEDDFKPGELFAKHLQKATGGTQANTSSNTGAQIRQATSQALKNIPESSTKLMKTPISKPSVKRDTTPTSERSADRSRESLLYSNDDDRPHAKIDHVLQRHKDERERDTDKTTNKHDKKDRDKTKEEPKQTAKMSRSDSPPKNETPHNKPNRNHDKPTSDQKRDLTKEVRKRRRSNSQEKPGPVSAEPHTLLRGVVLVLSGYENPRRANVRNTALALGARVERDWAPHCTHLICAFPNTPKLRAVRAASGEHVPVVRADWLEQVARRRRRLPWRWFATEPKHQRQPSDDELDEEPRDSEGDTDDEIEKVLQEQKRRRLTESNKMKQKRDDTSDASPAERGGTHTKAHDPEDDIATDEETTSAVAAARRFGGALPDFFEGYTFAIDAGAEDTARITRYVRAYGGLVLQMSALEEGSQVEYVVRGRGGARGVAPAWVARCHAARALLPRVS